jgi:hypothetical protein
VNERSQRAQEWTLSRASCTVLVVVSKAGLYIARPSRLRGAAVVLEILGGVTIGIVLGRNDGSDFDWAVIGSSAKAASNDTAADPRA